jgi:hypothetical protein
MCCCDDNPPSCFDAFHRRARKAHRCDECRRTIAVGESYLISTGLWEQGWDKFYTCAHCEAAAKALEVIFPDFCHCFGGLWESADETNRGWKHLESREAARLCVMAKRDWTRKRGPRKGELYPVPVKAAEDVPIR